LVPLGVGRHLEHWGIDPSRIDELDWWESISVNGVTLTSAPANYNSGRTGLDSNMTLWCSWAIQSNNGSIFYSGDTAYDSHFKEIKDRLGHFDVAFIEVAANVKEGVGFPVENCGHMQARHTMKAFEDLGADMLFPVHWSTFELFTHRWDEPMEDLILEANRAGALLVTPMIGEIVDLSSAHNTSFWWWEEELVNGEFIGGVDCSSFSV
jgi:L-ascorbate metabolism protein UlaG (beta-lactamase superfamily)